MVRVLNNVVESRLALLASVLVLGLAYWVNLEPSPYGKVNVVRLERVEGSIELVATFRKTACQFRKLVVVGGVLGETEFVDWHDIDGRDPDIDRTVGMQTLRVGINSPQDRHDWLEVRTKHDCNGRMVDKVFHRISPVI